MKRVTNSIIAASALAILVLAAAPGAKAASACSNHTLVGSYGATITGSIAGLPFAELDLVSAAGNGTFTGTGTVSYNGSVSTVTFTATYTINANCTGSASLSTGVTQNLVIKADGSEVMFIGTNSSEAQVTGDAKRLGSNN
ncbi:MAG TPA: hypothetical protein VG860_10545 [Terriglobia bacterium]|jgi:hypothetical protein|nr:hypothetical protein [Terriglobia bacterium]